ncbi:MAG: ATP-grasp domain-containing protein [Armatimonadetes bacterium]|nr:ATP-grasp domain-containing protein [Armatimonadota bacterium]
MVVKGLFSQASLVRAPTSVALNKTLPIDEMERSVDSLRTPLVVKPAFGGSSEGLVVADTHAIAIRAATAQLPKEGKVLVQELEDSESEISCTVLDDLEGPLFLPIVELVRGSAKVMGIEEKFGSTATGRHVVPARLTPELHDRVRHAVLRLHDAIGAVGLTRTDIIITKRGEVVILEINGIPGLLETSIACDASLAAGISFDELCVRYASTAFLDRPEPRVWGI